MTAFAAETAPAREVLAESRTMEDGGAAGVATLGAAGVEVAQEVLTDTQYAVLPLVPYLDPLHWVFIAVALGGIAVTIYACVDDWRAGPNKTKRLAVSPDAVLLNHAGAGHQVKVNKAAPGDTASLLFQTGFPGRAETGLAGDGDWSMKVSVDGAAWTEALCVDSAPGRVTGPACRRRRRILIRGK